MILVVLTYTLIDFANLFCNNSRQFYTTFWIPEFYFSGYIIQYDRLNPSPFIVFQISLPHFNISTSNIHGESQSKNLSCVFSGNLKSQIGEEVNHVTGFAFPRNSILFLLPCICYFKKINKLVKHLMDFVSWFTSSYFVSR